MKKKNYRFIFFIMAFLLMALPSVSLAAPILDFNMDGDHPTNASISYNASTAVLTGVNISVDTVLGKDTPINSGKDFQLNLQDGFLNFSTGNLLSVDGNHWIFSGNGNIQVTATSATTGSPAVPVAIGSTLLTGTITSLDLTLIGGVYKVAVATFFDLKDANLAAYFGLPGGQDFRWYGNFNLSFNTNNSFDPGTSFSSTQVLSGDITNTPAPIPAAFLLFGSGLFGLVFVRRRKN